MVDNIDFGLETLKENGFHTIDENELRFFDPMEE